MHVCVCVDTSVLHVCTFVFDFRDSADTRGPRVRRLALRHVLGADEPLQFRQFV